jgi:TRAP-type C4-dicarboxylate transport system permease small subunit
MDPIRFEWVEEVGELALAWLTLVGAAIGVRQRSHFTLHVLMPLFPSWLQRVIDAVLHLLIVGFGLGVAWYGYGLAKLNLTLLSPGLGISLAWLYASSVVGGILLAVYALSMVVRPSEPVVPGIGRLEGEI